MEPTISKLVCSNSLQNILNFRDVAQTINHIQGSYRLREGRIYRSARPVCITPTTSILLAPLPPQNTSHVSLKPEAISIGV